ncbi:hypothetical protein FQA39_LY08169 [Lamprigera yunnana]|nr:hypothetical protein FQA39_LY08169 [Lamprigera yunnana]
MFKVLIVCLVVTIIAMVTAYDPVKEAKMMIVNNCKTSVGASQEDLDIVLNHGLPTTDKGLCLVECLLSKGNMMKNGKLNKSGFLASSKREKKYTDAQLSQLEKMINACDEEINSAKMDGCHAAKHIVECTTTKGKEIDFKFPSRL